MHQEPDAGFDPGSPGSRPGPKAGAKPLHHPGIPTHSFQLHMKLSSEYNRYWVTNQSQMIPKDWDCSRNFSDHNALKLERNHKKKFGRNSNTWRLKNILLKDEWVNQKIREELKRFMETNENEDTTIQNLWDTEKAALEGKYITIQTSLIKLEKNSNAQANLAPKEIKERTGNKTYTRQLGDNKY